MSRLCNVVNLMNSKMCLFYHIFHKQDDKTKYLLCKLYMHNFFLEKHLNETIVPFVGYVQRQAFISFALNQIKWDKYSYTFQWRKHDIDLSIRGEIENPFATLFHHNSFLEKPNVASTLKQIHNEVLHLGREKIKDIKEEAINRAKMRWKLSSKEIKNREHFGLYNF